MTLKNLEFFMKIFVEGLKQDDLYLEVQNLKFVNGLLCQ